MPNAHRERFGLDETVIERINGAFTAFPSIKKVMLYGSRAKGNYRSGSDIDLTIIGTGVTEQEILALENRLDDLLLPYTIDLCIYPRYSQPPPDRAHRPGRRRFFPTNGDAGYSMSERDTK
uniref:Nucleotidyltransferase domain-containing protein n=1 Tax=Candidatus Kentrum sp. LPFa TaxID=2126335 RepID=A0A450WRJ1_9GAMM|nr:MAG: Nucleotidyltransferase domain-containing protein [Candidatus Kentron sp. LPFa]VFK33623.1 MAG: Nucleotidyltransferase domain-containing protein [Candidatus Kentron sp. LPFa]